MLEWTAGLLAKIVATRIGAIIAPIVKAVPRWAWIALAALLITGAGVLWHRHKAGAALAAADRAGYDRRTDEDAKALAVLAERARAAEATSTAISNQLRQAHEQQIRANASAADALGVRGPGAARCERVVDSSVPAAAGGPGAAGRTADASVAAVPDGAGPELVALPFTDTVAFGHAHDDYRSEVLAWHQWYSKMAAEWEKLRSSATRH